MKLAYKTPTAALLAHLSKARFTTSLFSTKSNSFSRLSTSYVKGCTASYLLASIKSNNSFHQSVKKSLHLGPIFYSNKVHKFKIIFYFISFHFISILMKTMCEFRLKESFFCVLFIFC